MKNTFVHKRRKQGRNSLGSCSWKSVYVQRMEPLNNRKTDPNQTFLFASRCSEHYMFARPHTTVPYQCQNKLITKSWFKPISSCFILSWISFLSSAAKCVLWNYNSLKALFIDGIMSKTIARRGCDLSTSQGSFYSNVQILVCLYFS